MKEAFRDWNPQDKTLDLLNDMAGILSYFHGLGYKMTLRQLYYQLVGKALIPNTLQSYSRIGDILVKARMAGMVDWGVIEDRGRQPKKKPEWEDMPDFIDSVVPQFRIERHIDQDVHVELWTEKQALESVIKPITDDYHIHLVVNKGYSSASAMYAAAKRFERYEDDWDQDPVIIYLGDHDPSGLDMDRDIEARIREMGVLVEVERIALTMPQVNKYNPPPNPAKLTDSRAKKYIALHGYSSWEVDALDPVVLDKTIRTAIEGYIDMQAYNDKVSEEEAVREKFMDAFEDIDWEADE